MKIDVRRELARYVGGPLADVGENAAEILSRQQVVVMGHPVGHVGRVVARVDDVVQVTVEQSFVARQREQLVQIGVHRKGRSGGCDERKIHVPAEQKRFSIFRARIEHSVVLIGVGEVAVAHASQGNGREGPQPLVHVEQLLRLLVEIIAREAERLGYFDEVAIVVFGPVVLDDEVVSVVFLAVAHVADGHGRSGVRVGNLKAFRAAGRGQRVVDQIVFELGALLAVFILGTEVHVVVPSQLQDGGAGRHARRFHVHQVVVHAGHVARVVEEVVDEDFILPVVRAEPPAARSIDADRFVHAAEQLIGMELHRVAAVDRERPAVLTAFQPHAHVVEDVALVDHRGAEALIAHHVDVGVQPRTVRRRHDDLKVVQILG